MENVESRQRVLFLEMDNSARSQMAEGLLRHLAGDRYDAHSAGPFPVPVRPEAVAVMREIGIDISTQGSKLTTGYLGQQFDAVFAVCDGDTEPCPVFPGGTTCWPIPNPAEGVVSVDPLSAHRAARDVIYRLVREKFDLG